MLRRMRPDLYSKAVLTLIALLLTAIACKTFISPETTASAQGSSATSKAQNASPHQNVRRGGKVTADNWDDENHGSSSNIAKLSWVNKRCRMWTEDGREIDIDQTCLVVRTVRGGLVVIPNAYVDEDSQETIDQLSKKYPDKDKWLRRFYEIGGGEKPRQ